MTTMPGIQAIQSYQGAARIPRSSRKSSSRRQRKRHEGQEGTERRKDAARFPAGQAEGSPILARYSGATRDSPVSKIDQAAHQKTAVPTTGEGDCPRPRQNEYAVPEWGHYGPTRGLGGIPS